jgi:hypothetical protein
MANLIAANSQIDPKTALALVMLTVESISGCRNQATAPVCMSCGW